MVPRRIAPWVALAVVLWLAGSPAVLAQPEGRRLGISVSEGELEYLEGFHLALAAGMETTGLSLGWDDLEPEPGVYDSTFLDVANVFFPAFGVSLGLTVTPVDTNNLRLPDDLAGRDLDDPVVVARLEALLDFVLSRVPDVELEFLSIGNEVDAYLRTPADWARYRTLFAAGAARARQLRPGVPVGVSTTFGGMTGPAHQEGAALNELADVVLVTYYPLEGDFTVRPPSVVDGDFDTVVGLYPGRTVIFKEAGYPYGDLCDSSKALQEEFVRRVFAAWDRHADAIPLVIFEWLMDVPESSVEIFRDYYGLDDPAFLEYLRTLGLVSSTGVPSPSYVALAREARERGWLADPRAGSTEPCGNQPGDVCLRKGRFRVAVTWRDFFGNTGPGRSLALPVDDTAVLWFFDDQNLESLVKVLDGCPVNGRFWVFAAAATTVQTHTVVTDTFTGRTRTYRNPLGRLAPALADTEAFATCDP